MGSVCENNKFIQKVQPSGKSSTTSCKAICPSLWNLNSKVLVSLQSPTWFFKWKKWIYFFPLISVTTPLFTYQVIISRSYINSSCSLCSRRGQLEGKCAAGYFCLAGSSQSAPQGPGFSWRFLSGCRWGQVCAGLCPAGKGDSQQ